MRPSFGGRDLVESSSPRLPRAWTTAGAGVLMTRFPRCEPTITMLADTVTADDEEAHRRWNQRHGITS